MTLKRDHPNDCQGDDCDASAGAILSLMGGAGGAPHDGLQQAIIITTWAEEAIVRL